MKDCVFCKRISEEKSADFVYQDEKVVAFDDLHPRAKVHVLIVPRKHIPTIREIEEEDKSLMGHLVWVAKKIAQDKGLTNYHLIFNVGVQEVFHIHLHLLSSDFKLLL
jgi:histidine triad (HIT) family protein